MAFVRRKGNSFYLVHNVRRGGKVRQLHLARLGDKGRITDQIVREVSKKHPFVELNWQALREQALARLKAEHPTEFAFLDAFRNAVPPDAVISADMCIPGYWIAALHPFAKPRQLLYPMGWGTLGFGFPAAMGPAAAGIRTVSVNGDGGFLFACGELATVAQLRAAEHGRHRCRHGAAADDVAPLVPDGMTRGSASRSGTPGRPARRPRPSAPSAACRRSPSSSTASA